MVGPRPDLSVIGGFESLEEAAYLIASDELAVVPYTVTQPACIRTSPRRQVLRRVVRFIITPYKPFSIS